MAAAVAATAYAAYLDGGGDGSRRDAADGRPHRGIGGPWGGEVRPRVRVAAAARNASNTRGAALARRTRSPDFYTVSLEAAECSRRAYTPCVQSVRAACSTPRVFSQFTAENS